MIVFYSLTIIIVILRQEGNKDINLLVLIGQSSIHNDLIDLI